MTFHINTYLRLLRGFLKKYRNEYFTRNLVTMLINDCIFLPLQSQNKKTLG